MHTFTLQPSQKKVELKHTICTVEKWILFAYYFAITFQQYFIAANLTKAPFQYITKHFVLNDHTSTCTKV